MPYILKAGNFTEREFSSTPVRCRKKCCLKLLLFFFPPVCNASVIIVVGQPEPPLMAPYISQRCKREGCVLYYNTAAVNKARSDSLPLKRNTVLHFIYAEKESSYDAQILPEKIICYQHFAVQNMARLGKGYVRHSIRVRKI